MTAEANSRISSISGSNLNTISGSADNKNGGATRKQTPAAAPTTTPATSKRNNPTHPIKTDEIEVQVADQNSATNPQLLSKSGRLVGWLFCGPCIQFLKESTTCHKMAITTVTLIVTSLLVASPILFLISAAPVAPHRDCMIKEDDDCLVPLPPPECQEVSCRTAAVSIQAKINWEVDYCKDFKSFSCSSVPQNSLRAVKSPQEIADNQMLQLLTFNTTSGPFRKLGRLYESCMRQTLNSTSIRLAIEKLGGYLPISALGPSTVSPLLVKFSEMGAPIPLLDVYYDLSWGKKPQALLIIDVPMHTSSLLENPVRWMTPKAPTFKIGEDAPSLLNEVLRYFLPMGLSIEQKESERQSLFRFISELNQIRRQNTERDFAHSYVVNNVSVLAESYPFECLQFQLNWMDLLPNNWTGPIVVRSPKYLRSLRDLLLSHSNRVIHNSLLLLFALGTLPPGQPTPLVCTKATMSNMPEASSALFIAQYSEDAISDAIQRSNAVFELLKAHLKRAPSLRGAALVRLASLKLQSAPWPTLLNTNEALSKLNELEITSDNWFENVLRIYDQRTRFSLENATTDYQRTYAYPTIAKAFYDTLSHKIVVPLSLILVPYFDSSLPLYMHYATVGNIIAKEILRSVTKAFEDKAMRCVPTAVEIFSNSSRMELLISSGGMQIAYHSMLTISGSKAMARLPGLNLSSTQLFFLVTAQELCAKSEYDGVSIGSEDFSEILSWLIAQGGFASDTYKCQFGSQLRIQQNCGIW